MEGAIAIKDVKIWEDFIGIATPDWVKYLAKGVTKIQHEILPSINQAAYGIAGKATIETIDIIQFSLLHLTTSRSDEQIIVLLSRLFSLGEICYKFDGLIWPYKARSGAPYIGYARKKNWGKADLLERIKGLMEILPQMEAILKEQLFDKPK